MLDPTPLRLVAVLAPAPNDIVWPNTYTTHRQRLIRGWSITFISGLVSLLWASPIGALSGFLEPAYLERILPGVADFFNSKSIVAVFVQGFLPTFLYTLFNGVAPFIFDWLSSWQGYISSADAELANVSKYFPLRAFLISGISFIYSSISLCICCSVRWQILRRLLRILHKFLTLLPRNSLKSLVSTLTLSSFKVGSQCTIANNRGGDVPFPSSAVWTAFCISICSCRLQNASRFPTTEVPVDIQLRHVSATTNLGLDTMLEL